MVHEVQYNIPVLTQDEQLLQEVLGTYGNKSILPDKDQTAKLMLLKVFLKKQLIQLAASEPNVSFKQAVQFLVGLVPDDEHGETFHLAVFVVSKYWSDLTSNSRVSIVNA